MQRLSARTNGRGVGEKDGPAGAGRFSGATRGMMVGYVSPEAAAGGPIGLVKNGDRIRINAEKGFVQLDLSARELKARKAKAPKREGLSGVLEKYAAQVGSAYRGAVTHRGVKKT